MIRDETKTVGMCEVKKLMNAELQTLNNKRKIPIQNYDYMCI